MAQLAHPRSVACYHCGHQFQVGRRAQSTACPHCGRSVIVGDLVVKSLEPVSVMQTCGKVIIRRGGRVIAKKIIAHEGVIVEGVVDATVETRGHVEIGKKARWKGDLTAASLQVNAGAQILGGFFSIHPAHARHVHVAAVTT